MGVRFENKSQNEIEIGYRLTRCGNFMAWCWLMVKWLGLLGLTFMRIKL